MKETAGRILNEEDLRAYSRCTQFYHYGGKAEYPVVTSLVKETVERMVCDALLLDIENPRQNFIPYLKSSMRSQGVYKHLLEGEQIDLQTKSTFALNDFYALVSPNMYIPIAGPYTFRFTVEGTVLELTTSAIFRKASSKELIGIYFSPFTVEHSMLNDLIPYYLTMLLSQYGQKHFARNTASVFVFGFDKFGKIVSRVLGDKEVNQEVKVVLANLVRGIRAGVHFPLNPCQLSCPFKQTCYPTR